MAISKLELARRCKRLGARQLGDMLGVSNQTILNIEKYKVVPKLDLALKLSKLLEIELEDLLSEEVLNEIKKIGE